MNTQNINIQLKNRIMHRVYGIWFVRRVLPRLLIEGAVAFIIVRELANRVFVNHVLSNAALHTFARTPLEFVQYFGRAFMNTESLTQILLAGSFILASLLVRDFLHTTRRFAVSDLGTRNFSRLARV